MRLEHRWAFLQIDLAVLAKYLVAIFAFQWHVWEGTAHHALDLIYQLFLELICDFIFLDVNLWNRLWSHKLVDGSIWENKVILESLHDVGVALVSLAPEFLVRRHWVTLLAINVFGLLIL